VTDKTENDLSKIFVEGMNAEVSAGDMKVKRINQVKILILLFTTSSPFIVINISITQK
jgi:hypothetical protein